MAPETVARPAPEPADSPTVCQYGTDRSLAYAEYGPPDGTPVVFLHGTPGSRLLGGLFEGAAQEHGVRLVAPDRPGYGESTAWPDRDIVDAETYLTALLDHVDVDTAGFVAFSGGVPDALAMAASRPERVASLDVLSGATPPDVDATTPLPQRLLAGIATTAPPVLRTLLRGQAWLAGRLDPSVVVAQYTTGDGAAAIPDDVAATVGADFVEALSGDGCGAATEFRNTASDWGIDYEAITVPVRFHHGTADTNVPPTGVRDLQRRVPSASLDLLDDSDHLETLLRSRGVVLRNHC
jgi:pimeloyl-ACP methyl ester carboxylesterase